MKHTTLPQSFYARDTHVVAQELLGKLLVHKNKTTILSGRVTEVECYVGENDLASHASKGKTKRTSVMYGEAGLAYIYLIYGMYHCLNIVTEKKDIPAAILIRALEPVNGIPHMQTLRNTENIFNLTTGPGKLCQALDISMAHNASSLTKKNDLYVVDDGYTVPRTTIRTSPRIGVAYAGEAAAWPWRYYVADSPYVSKHPKNYKL